MTNTTAPFRPTWKAFNRFLKDGDSLILASPFISESGVDQVAPGLLDHEVSACRVVTRLSPTDWAEEISSPEAIHDLLGRLSDGGAKVTLQIVRPLHAKLYVVDNKRAWMGSANLTAAGFGRNIELMVELHGTDAAQAVATLDAECRSFVQPLPLADLAKWVTDHRAEILAARAQRRDLSESLANAQRTLRKLLPQPRIAGKTKKLRTGKARLPDLDAFAAWLDKHRGTEPSKTISTKLRNKDGQNMQGHVKQGYHALAHFFATHESLRVKVARMRPKSAGGIFQPTHVPGLLDAWLKYFAANAGRSGERFDYDILTGQLPPSLGGSRSNGGGGSGVFKRLMPLVADFLG